jgi:hypothetical protein
LDNLGTQQRDKDLIRKKTQEDDVAIKVRMGYYGLLDVFCVTGALLYFIIDSIPHVMKYYADLPRVWGIICVIIFCVFLMRIGTMLITFVQTYLDIRDLSHTIILTMKDIRGKMVTSGKVIDES